METGRAIDGGGIERVAKKHRCQITICQTTVATIAFQCRFRRYAVHRDFKCRLADDFVVVGYRYCYLELTVVLVDMI